MTPEQTAQTIREAFQAERELWGIPSEGDALRDGTFSDEAIERAVQITMGREPMTDEAIRMRHNQHHREYMEKRRAS